MKSDSPRAKIGRFKISTSSSNTLELERWDDEPPPIDAMSYITPCKGDSGSGHWLTTVLSEDKTITIKTVLAAVYATKYHATWKTPDGKERFLPCGGVIDNAKTDRKSNVNGPSSIKTANEEIFEWIKIMKMYG